MQSRQYLARPFNFYVYPMSKVGDSVQKFQVSAIRFLSENNFDFNTLFAKPISYTRLSDYE